MQLGFYYDQDKCIACGTCVTACATENHLEFPAYWRRLTTNTIGGVMYSLVSSCWHCAEPLCLYVCPAKAITKREEDGVVLIDREKCRVNARCGIILDKPAAKRQAPCTIGCPAKVKIPEYVALIAAGKYKAALELIMERIPLPGVLGRVCHHPCEPECTRKNIDEPVAIASLKAFVCDHAICSASPAHRIWEENVAIVGSGPAGLAAAYDLVRKGYGVTVFEALSVGGGVPAMCIPDYRLPRSVVERDLEYIVKLGVEIKFNTKLGVDLTLDDLSHNGYSAILLANGAHIGKELQIPGKELKGIIDGLSFLKRTKLGEIVELDAKVAVVGGSNVAIDSARSALRLGAKEAHVLYRRSRDQMTAYPKEIEEAENEGVIIHYLVVPTRFLRKDGKVQGIECTRVDLREGDARGKSNPVSIEGSDFVVEADAVIIAIGELPDISFVSSHDGLDITPAGTLAVDSDTLETSRKGIFATGDVVGNAGTVIDAVCAGQKAAASIERYLRGDTVPTRSVNRPEPVDLKVEVPEDVGKLERQQPPLLPLSQRVGNFREVALGFDERTARLEAQRCLNCAGSLCAGVCPYGVPQFENSDNETMQKCNFCTHRLKEGKKPKCVVVCPQRAIDAGPLDELMTKYGGGKEIIGFRYSEMCKPSVIFSPRKISSEGGQHTQEGICENQS